MKATGSPAPPGSFSALWLSSITPFLQETRVWVEGAECIKGSLASLSPQLVQGRAPGMALKGVCGGPRVEGRGWHPRQGGSRQPDTGRAPCPGHRGPALPLPAESQFGISHRVLSRRMAVSGRGLAGPVLLSPSVHTGLPLSLRGGPRA